MLHRCQDLTAQGTQSKLSGRQEAHLVSQLHSGEYSTREVADLFKIGPLHRVPGDRTPTTRSTRRRHAAAPTADRRRPGQVFRSPHPSGTPAHRRAHGPSNSGRDGCTARRHVAKMRRHNRTQPVDPTTHCVESRPIRDPCLPRRRPIRGKNGRDQLMILDEAGTTGERVGSTPSSPANKPLYSPVGPVSTEPNERQGARRTPSARITVAEPAWRGCG